MSRARSLDLDMVLGPDYIFPTPPKVIPLGNAPPAQPQLGGEEIPAPPAGAEAQPGNVIPPLVPAEIVPAQPAIAINPLAILGDPVLAQPPVREVPGQAIAVRPPDKLVNPLPVLAGSPPQPQDQAPPAQDIAAPESQVSQVSTRVLSPAAAVPADLAAAAEPQVITAESVFRGPARDWLHVRPLLPSMALAPGEATSFRIMVVARQRCSCQKQLDNARAADAAVANIEAAIADMEAQVEAYQARLAELENYRIDLYFAEDQVADIMDRAPGLIDQWQKYLDYLKRLGGPIGIAGKRHYSNRPKPGWIKIGANLWAADQTSARTAQLGAQIAPLLTPILAGGPLGLQLTTPLTMMIQAAQQALDQNKAALDWAKVNGPKIENDITKTENEIANKQIDISHLEGDVHTDSAVTLPDAEERAQQAWAAYYQCLQASPPCPDAGDIVVTVYDLVFGDGNIVETPIPPPPPMTGPPPSGPPGKTPGPGAPGGPAVTAAPPAPNLGGAIITRETSPQDKKKIDAIYKERQKVRDEIHQLETKAKFSVPTPQELDRLSKLHQEEVKVDAKLNREIVRAVNAAITRARRRREKTGPRYRPKDLKAIDGLKAQKAATEARIAELKKKEAKQTLTEPEAAELAAKQQDNYELDAKINDAVKTAIRNAEKDRRASISSRLKKTRVGHLRNKSRFRASSQKTVSSYLPEDEVRLQEEAESLRAMEQELGRLGALASKPGATEADRQRFRTLERAHMDVLGKVAADFEASKRRAEQARAQPTQPAPPPPGPVLFADTQPVLPAPPDKTLALGGSLPDTRTLSDDELNQALSNPAS